MSQVFVVLGFGLPAVFLSLALCVIGVLKDKFWMVILGSIAFIPFSFYLSGLPDLRGFAFLLPLFQMGSVAAVRENNKVWAWILLLPAIVASLWILAIVLISNF